MYTAFVEEVKDQSVIFGEEVNKDVAIVYSPLNGAGFGKIQGIMAKFREGMGTIGGKKVLKTLDYKQGLEGLPKSDVLKFLLKDNCSVVMRPSGTEPKLKVYLSVSAENRMGTVQEEHKMAEHLKR